MNMVAQLLGFRPSCQAEPAEASTSFRVSPFVRASAHDDGLALLHIQCGQIFLCNRTGSRIWRGLFAGRKPEEVADEMSRHFGLESEIARKHTFSFVGELERRGLIIRTGGS
jgi:Coenzyme PQQ synthesis protein D (PqqD)